MYDLAVPDVDRDVADRAVEEDQVTGLQVGLDTGVPTWDWARLLRGSEMPACANDHLTRPEQSNALGPAAPQR